MDGLSESMSQYPSTLNGVTSGVDWGSFFNGAGGLVDKYLAYRIAKSGDAKGRDGQPQPVVIAGQAVPGWVLPTALIAGLGLVVYMVVHN